MSCTCNCRLSPDLTLAGCHPESMVRDKVAVSLDLLKGNERKAIKLMLKQYDIKYIRVQGSYFDEEQLRMIEGEVIIGYSNKYNPKEKFEWKLNNNFLIR